jgi:GNAT superfamily N-acetyltransferase
LEKSTLHITLFTPDNPHWPAYVAHLRRVNMAKWALVDGNPMESLHYLGAVDGETVIGHISLRQQPITCPTTDWSAALDHAVTGPDGEALQETYVYTFAVDADHQRQGIGSGLQEAALAYTRDLGCYQMRSWSSLNHPENYALKIKLGFAMHPERFTTDGGLTVTGVYFVKTV